MGISLIDGEVDFQTDVEFTPQQIKAVSGGVASFHLGSDAQLDVKFYKKRLPVASKSTKEALHFEEYDYIRIQRPGDRSSVVERRVRDYDKRRFPMHWQQYQMGATQMVGTPLERMFELGLLNQTQIEMLKYSGTRTVEQVAAAAPAVTSGWGPDGEDIQRLARGFISDQQRAKIAAEDATEKAERLKKEQEQVQKIAALEAKLEAIASSGESKTVRKAKTKAKRKRRTKAQIEADKLKAEENSKIYEELSPDGKEVLVVEG